MVTLSSCEDKRANASAQDLRALLVRRGFPSLSPWYIGCYVQTPRYPPGRPGKESDDCCSSVQGHAYLLGDFIVRVGQCRKGAVYRGLCLEVSSKYRIQVRLTLTQDAQRNHARF